MRVDSDALNDAILIVGLLHAVELLSFIICVKTLFDGAGETLDYAGE